MTGFEELRARMGNTQQETRDTPDTPNAENCYPSTPDIVSNHYDDDVVAQVKPPTLKSKDRLLTIKEENNLLVENQKQKEEITICHQQNRCLNEKLNCLSEKLQQSSTEKKDLEETIIVLQHVFSAALEENNKLRLAVL